MIFTQELQNESEEPQLTPEEYLEQEKRTIRRRSYWAIGIGAVLTLAHVGWLLVFSLAGAKVDFSILFKSILFIIGLFALAAGIYGLIDARRLKLQDIVPSPEAIAFLQGSVDRKPVYSTTLVAVIVFCYVLAVLSGLENSVEAAGLVKYRVIENGEYWRLLTCGVLHGGILHIYFNSQALYGFGSMIEAISARAHLAIVFVISIISGSLLSTIMLPDSISIGASGGIMGLIGYLTIYGYLRRGQLPPGFLKSILINVALIAAIGIIAYQFIDNFAHFGGFCAGAIYGLIQIPSDKRIGPRISSPLIVFLGFAALVGFLAAALFAALKILKLT